jgi:hypothetical protein
VETKWKASTGGRRGVIFSAKKKMFRAPAIRSESSHRDARAVNGNAHRIRLEEFADPAPILADTDRRIPVPLVASYSIWH